MGIMSSQDFASRDKTVERGVGWLVRQQRVESTATRLAQDQSDGDARTWHETQYTGTGFPGHFYLGYDLYRHYFPVMALGRYVRRLGKV